MRETTKRPRALTNRDTAGMCEARVGSAGPISATYGVSDPSGLRCNRSPASRDSIYRVPEIDLSISLQPGNTSIFAPIVFHRVLQASAGLKFAKCEPS